MQLWYAIDEHVLWRDGDKKGAEGRWTGVLDMVYTVARLLSGIMLQTTMVRSVSSIVSLQ